jgi:hypothetical protein
MLRGARGVLLVATLVAALAPRAARGQDDPSPPVSEMASETGMLPADLATVLPPARPPQPVPPLPTGAPDPGPGGWGFYGPPSRPAGPFFSLELQFIRPALKEVLENGQPLPATGSTIQPPSASVGWTIAPWIEAGYWLPDSLGLLSAGYRFFNSQGNALIDYGGTPSAVRTRLDLNTIDLDYGTAPYFFWRRWEWRWWVGLRLADVYFDSQVQSPGTYQQASNSSRGAGPHARFSLNRYFDSVPGLSLGGRLDGACLFQRNEQKFRQTLTNPDGSLTSELGEQNGHETVPTILVEAGLGYVPPRLPNLRLRAGYIYEEWWFVGQLGTYSNFGMLSPSRGQFTTQGLFVRAWIDF